MSDNRLPPRALHRIGPRVAVFGPSGAGKTTLSKELSLRLGVPHVELDGIYHKTGWQSPPDEQFRQEVAARLAQHADGWVCDGNYGAVRDLVLLQADTVAWLRPPFRVAYWRLVGRTVRGLVSRKPLWGNVREPWRITFLSRDSILLWGVSHWRQGLSNTEEALRKVPHHADVHELRSNKEVAAWLATIPERTREQRLHSP